MGEPTFKDVVRAAIHAFSAQDRDGFADLHADVIVVHGPTGDIHGVEAVTDEEFGIFDVFSDLTWTLDSVISEENLVAVRLTATGTHDGNLGDITPTGTRVSFASYGIVPRRGRPSGRGVDTPGPAGSEAAARHDAGHDHEIDKPEQRGAVTDRLCP